MSSHLLLEATGGVGATLAVLGVIVSARPLALVLRTWIEQTSRTRRLIKALEDSRPSQRPQIIKACSELEGNPEAWDGDAAAGRLPARARPRSSATPARKRIIRKGRQE